MYQSISPLLRTLNLASEMAKHLGSSHITAVPGGKKAVKNIQPACTFHGQGATEYAINSSVIIAWGDEMLQKGLMLSRLAERFRCCTGLLQKIIKRARRP